MVDMKSLRELLILGPGPSSSHTIGPYRIVQAFKKEHGSDFHDVEVILKGSLSLTGKGHGTDRILRQAFDETPVRVRFEDAIDSEHPNTMVLIGHKEDGKEIQETYYSIGGGAFRKKGQAYAPKDIYPFSTFDGMKEYMSSHGVEDIYELVEMVEGKDILEYGKSLLEHSFSTIESGLKETAILPGPLKLVPVAGKICQKAMEEDRRKDRRMLLLAAFSYATSEENARGKEVVTSPTCGASGVVPAVLYYEKKFRLRQPDELARAYLVGALICDFIKENAAISGAMYGCQAEIGSAASFASAALAYLDGLSVYQIEYAAEVAMEHFLGLTCDPVDGYVQIPCIERNAMAAIHSYAAYLFSKDIALYRHNLVSFDNVVRAMKETGQELPPDLKETSLGGLAKIIGNC